MKKLLSIALACATVLCLAAPVFAAETDLTQNTAITGSTNVGTIKLTVPGTGNVTLNPYKLKVKVDSKDVQDQVISTTQGIKNESTVPLQLGVTVTSTVGGKMVLATKTTAGDSKLTTKSAFLQFEVAKSSTEPKADFDWTTATGKTAITLKKGAATFDKAATPIVLDASSGTADYLAFHLTGDAVGTPAEAWAADDKVDVAVAFTFLPTAATVAP